MKALAQPFRLNGSGKTLETLGFTQGCDVSGFQPEEYELGHWIQTSYFNLLTLNSHY